jgi:hypothetical protein
MLNNRSKGLLIVSSLARDFTGMIHLRILAVTSMFGGIMHKEEQRNLQRKPNINPKIFQERTLK